MGHLLEQADIYEDDRETFHDSMLMCVRCGSMAHTSSKRGNLRSSCRPVAGGGRGFYLNKFRAGQYPGHRNPKGFVLAHVGAPAPEVRAEWLPFFSAWAQGLPGPAKIAEPTKSAAREGRLAPPAADWQRVLALYGLSDAGAQALGRQAEERKAKDVEEEEDVLSLLA